MTAPADFDLSALTTSELLDLAERCAREARRRIDEGEDDEPAAD